MTARAEKPSRAAYMRDYRRRRKAARESGDHERYVKARADAEEQLARLRRAKADEAEALNLDAARAEFARYLGGVVDRIRVLPAGIKMHFPTAATPELLDFVREQIAEAFETD